MLCMYIYIYIYIYIYCILCHNNSQNHHFWHLWLYFSQKNCDVIIAKFGQQSPILQTKIHQKWLFIPVLQKKCHILSDSVIKGGAIKRK